MSLSESVQLLVAANAQIDSELETLQKQGASFVDKPTEEVLLSISKSRSRVVERAERIREQELSTETQRLEQLFLDRAQAFDEIMELAHRGFELMAPIMKNTGNLKPEQFQTVQKEMETFSAQAEELKERLDSTSQEFETERARLQNL